MLTVKFVVHEVVDFDLLVDRVKRLREEKPRSSSQSRQDPALGSQRSSAASRRSRSRDRRRSRDHVRSTPDKSSSVRPSRPYAAGLAAQLSQKRKQLEARAKEKSKLEKENLAKFLSAVDTEDTKIEVRSNTPSLKETKEKKIIIEIDDDDEQHLTSCQKSASVELSNGSDPVLEENTSLKGDNVSTSTTNSTPASSSDASSTQSDDRRHDAMQASDSQQTDANCSAAKSAAPAVLSLMNLPMPPVASESDSEVTPASTDT